MYVFDIVERIMIRESFMEKLCGMIKIINL